MIQESFCSTTWKAPRLDTAGEKTGSLESAEYVPSRNTAPSPLLMSVPGALIGHNKHEIARSVVAKGVTNEKGLAIRAFVKQPKVSPPDVFEPALPQPSRPQTGSRVAGRSAGQLRSDPSSGSLTKSQCKRMVKSNYSSRDLARVADYTKIVHTSKRARRV